MSLTLRMTYQYHYRGRRYSRRSTKTFQDPEHARRYVRKVIEKTREVGERYGYRPKGRNDSSSLVLISAWTEGLQAGDPIDVWTPTRGWTKGEVYAAGRELRARVLPQAVD